MKIAVGLSGGVDSALAAALLVEQGYKVIAVFLECWQESGCRADADRKDALAVALKLRIPFRVLDFKREYRERVLEEFYREYRAGRTPNPDIVCNREIKFGLFLDWSLKQGFDLIATGHYARIIYGSAGKIFMPSQLSEWLAPSDESLRVKKFALPAPVHLIQAVDKAKDQTYFLALLKQEQLQRVLFPIGHLTKKQVRVEAKKRGLPVWDKKDSSGICLVGDHYSFEEFLKRKIKPHPGEVVNNKGEVIGAHKGVEFYTIGQRHNFKILEKSNSRPRYFVIKKELKQNRLVVGSRRDLGVREFEVEKWSTIIPNFQLPTAKLTCRIRHQGRLIACKIEGKKVKLSQPEYGIAPGQAAVVYHGLECLGGGVIKR